MIAAMTVYALTSQNARRVYNAPSLLTSLGIFGTFLGITIGLTAFNPADIAGSVPLLFGGIKLAFWTSVAGILGGILVKLRLLLYPLRGQSAGAGAGNQKATADDMVRAMHGVERGLTDEASSPLLGALAAAGESQAAMARQMERQGQDATDAINALRESSDAGFKELGQMSGEQMRGLADRLGQTQEEMMSRLQAAQLDELRQMREALVGPGGAASTLGETLQRGQEGMASAVDRAAAGLRDTVGERMAADSEAVLARLDAMREGSESLGDRLSEALGANRESIAKALEGNRDAMAAMVAGAVSDLRDALVGPDGAASELTRRIQGNQVEMAAAMARAAEQLRDSVGENMASLTDRLTQSGRTTADQFNGLKDAMSALGDSMGGDSAALIERLDKLGASSEAMGERLAGAMEGNRDAMAAQIAAAVTDLRNALVGPDGAASSLGKELQRGQDEMTKTLEQAGSGLRGDVAALNDRLGSDSAAVLARLDNMREGSESLGDRLSEALGANRESIAKALEGNRDAMAAMVAGAVSDLRDALVGPDGAASELTRRIQGNQMEMAGAMARAAEQLRDSVGDNLGALTERMTESGRTTAEQFNNLQDALGALQGSMGSDSAALREHLDSLERGAGTRSEELAKALEGNREAIAAQIAGAVSELRDALVGPDGAVGALAGRLQQGQADLAGALAKAGEDMREGASRDVQALGESFQEGFGGLSGDIGTMATSIADAVDDLRVALVGPQGTTTGLADEIRNAQQDNNQALSAIKESLDENTQRQVDYSPKELLTALEEMIKQFNTQFSGQFWEKFDGFNRSIADLIGWMDTYRKQLGDMNDQHTRTTRNMDLATRRFDEIAGRSEIFIDVSKSLGSLLGGLDSQRVQMESHLKQYAHIVDTTRNNLENIEQKIIDGNENMNGHVRDISERIEEQVIRLDGALDAELSKAMNSFGQQLAALSEKFVDDYGPLTNRLREVVSIANRV